MITLMAFAVGFVLAIPAEGFEIMPYVTHSIGLGLVATGLYKVGSTIASK
jgi:hypothetical protein